MEGGISTEGGIRRDGLHKTDLPCGSPVKALDPRVLRDEEGTLVQGHLQKAGRKDHAPRCSAGQLSLPISQEWEGAGPTAQLPPGTRGLVLSPSTQAHQEGVVRTDRQEWRHTWVKFDYPDSG